MRPVTESSPPTRGHLPTERPNAASRELDRVSITEAVALVQGEDRRIHDALEAAAEDIAAAIELVVDRLAGGGRLFYVGAGTSGRLGVLDAVECPPTFQTDPQTVQAVIAGGPPAITGAVEGAEDDPEAAGRELAERGLDANDVVVGIAAGGTTPYVHGALRYARSKRAATVFLACVPKVQVSDEADVSIRVVTGPEVVAGSTRMKAGTATKLVLNTISTIAMSRLGKLHGNLMVDVNARGSAKLAERARRIVGTLTGTKSEEAGALLARADGQVKLAVVMGRLGLDADEARARLEQSGGFLRRALEG